ncbi:hypothetical protein [Nocardia wallacei]|uniref:hypothetical protein n=1 Tax=Nocardia wallacei TaxID=480035 RepID=UPI0024586701|nr:hypothetical protein [Nocardia wallacei]
MTLYTGWQLLAEPATGHPVVVAAVMAWTCQLLACAREWLRHRLTRMIVRTAPAGSRVVAARRCRGGSLSMLVVEVGRGDAAGIDPARGLLVGEKHPR